MKKLFYISLMILGVCVTTSAQNSINSLSFLKGTWKAEDKNLYESWNIEENNVFTGQSYKMKDGSKKISEHLKIRHSGDKLIYTATVLSQNNGQGINFNLKSDSESIYSFENLNHDFPKKIIYQKLNENEIFVQVLGENDKGFSYKMKKVDEPKTIPQWFMKDLENNIGRWIADNSKHKSEKEPSTSYGIEWKWGIGKTSIIGRLFGVVDGKETGDFWQFRQYWDNVKGEGIIVQFGHGGVMGIGNVKQVENIEDTTQTVQTFSLTDGRTWEQKHILKMEKTQFVGTSYDKDKDNNWVKSRSYTWLKQ